MEMKKPNEEKIRSIVTELKIDPHNISYYFINQKMFDFKKRKVKGKNQTEKKKVTPIANRTFAEILKGSYAKEESLKALAELFSRLYKNKIISLSDITIETREDILTNNLKIIQNYNDLLNERSSAFKIPFFNFNITEEIEPKINKLLKHIDEIFDVFKPKVKIDSDEERIKLSQYSSELKIISEINSILNFLKENKIYLYSGTIKNIPLLYTDLTQRTEYLENDVNGIPILKKNYDAKVIVEKNNYNIFYFTNYKVGEYVEAKYTPRFSFSELEKVVKKNPFKKTIECDHNHYTLEHNKCRDDINLDAGVFYGDIFYKKYNHTSLLPFNFDRSKIDFSVETKSYKNKDYVKGADPLLDKYLEENNLTFEKAMQQGEDLAAEELINYWRGK